MILDFADSSPQGLKTQYADNWVSDSNSWHVECLSMENTRRDILRLSGAVLATGLAGCQSSKPDNDRDTDTPADTTTTSTETTTQTETETTTTQEPGYTLEKALEFRNQTREQTIQKAELETRIQEMKNGEEFGDYQVSWWTYPGDYENFSLEFLQQTEDPIKAIKMASPPIKETIARKYGGVFSGQNDMYTAGVEKIVNDVNDNIDLFGGYITCPEYGGGESHGISFFFDRESENWFQADTTSPEVVQLNVEGEIQGQYAPGGSRAQQTGGVYDALTRFEPGDPELEGLHYETKARTSKDGILSLATLDGHIDLSDTWAQSKAKDLIYDGIRNGIHIDEFIDIPAETVYRAVENGEDHVGFYTDGDNLEDIKVVQGNQELYDLTMENPEPTGTEQINQLLEA